jgi:hypothetical protein
MMQVPYLSQDHVEGDADSLLAEFAQTRDVIIEPPIPIEDRVERHLKLTPEFNDLARMFGMPRDPEGGPENPGAIFFNEQRVVVDDGLDSHYNPSKEFEYRFILAPEVGHWCLHRPLFAEDLTPPSIVSPSSQGKETHRLAGGPRRPTSILPVFCDAPAMSCSTCVPRAGARFSFSRIVKPGATM